MKKTVKRLGSVLLVLCMIFMLAPSGAYALVDVDDDYCVYITDNGNDISVVIDGSVKPAPAGDSINSVVVADNDGADPASMSVCGSGYNIPNNDDCFPYVLVSGSVGGEGVKTVAIDDAWVCVTVDGNISGSSIGAHVDNSGDYAWSFINATGDVNGNSVGVQIDNTGTYYNRGDVIIDGTVSSAGTGVVVSNTGESNSAYVEVGKSVEGAVNGVILENKEEYAYASVTVEGNVVGTSEYGIKASTEGTGFHQWETGDSSVAVNGSVEGGTTGIFAESSEGSAYIRIIGSVTGGTNGIYASSDSEGETIVSALNGVKAGTGIGIEAASNESLTEAWTFGDIEGGSVGVKASASNNSYTLAGAVGNISGSTGMIIANSGGEVMVGAIGDPDLATPFTTSMDELYSVTGGDKGIDIQAASENSQTVVVIDGVLKVDDGGSPIVLGDAVTETAVDNINITVWKIEGQNEGADVVSGGAGDAAATLQSAINYIIKIADDDDSQTVFGANYADGDTFNAGEREIAVTVPNGFELTAYATEGTEIAIEKRDDGKYYALIPNGGGVYLHAVLSKAAAQSASEDVKISVSVSPALILTETLTAEDGTKITLRFFNNGTFTIGFEDGRMERGRYKLSEGRLAFLNRAGTECFVGEDGKVSFVVDPTQTIVFQLSSSSVELLTAAAK